MNPLQIPSEAFRYHVVNLRSRLELGASGATLRVIDLWWSGRVKHFQRIRILREGAAATLFDLGERVAPNSPVWLPVFSNRQTARDFAASPDVEVRLETFCPEYPSGVSVQAFVASKWAPWPSLVIDGETCPDGVPFDVDFAASLDLPGAIGLAPLYFTEADLLIDDPREENPTSRPRTITLYRPLIPPCSPTR